ncbi:Synaptotagmin-6 [Xenoophorus captivus]|uniref:Synaptotagmin-6 n=1 Tax=Xenoophorus captivus TaxID=1517983 RepID=A0ABV0R3A3_9TELE
MRTESCAIVCATLIYPGVSGNRSFACGRVPCRSFFGLRSIFQSMGGPECIQPGLVGRFERHNSFKRHLPRQMQVGSLDLGNDYMVDRDEKPTSLGRIQPELYQQKASESEDSTKNGSGKNCGRINISLKYDYENEALLVNILRAVDLPAKDLCGTSDPYVKVYLLPDRKKFQTRVHRKTLNPTFNESFQFPVPYDELPIRKLHMSVFDFDRFSRHDMIGEVVLENLFEMSDLSRETNIWRDIQYATSVRISFFCFFL